MLSVRPRYECYRPTARGRPPCPEATPPFPSGLLISALEDDAAIITKGRVP